MRKKKPAMSNTSKFFCLPPIPKTFNTCTVKSELKKNLARRAEFNRLKNIEDTTGDICMMNYMLRFYTCQWRKLEAQWAEPVSRFQEKIKM